MSLADADSPARHRKQAGMRLVPGGAFRMGSDKAENECHDSDRVPQLGIS
jgi:hypothetical protein